MKLNRRYRRKLTIARDHERWELLNGMLYRCGPYYLSATRDGFAIWTESPNYRYLRVVSEWRTQIHAGRSIGRLFRKFQRSQRRLHA